MSAVSMARKVFKRTRFWRAGTCVSVLTLGLATLAGCNDLTGTQPLPAGTSDPSIADNIVGANRMASAALGQFQFALARVIPITGLLTDELEATARNVTVPGGTGNNDTYVAVDARQLVEGSPHLGAIGDTYATLQQTRALAAQAIGALGKYSPDSSAHRRAELSAIEGYAEVMLADIFCSGVPLSTSNYKHDFTYKPSSTTAQVYQHAIVMFDSALTLGGDSAAVSGLASVGQGRALLALGKYAEAAQAVANVPSDFAYTESIFTCGSTNPCNLGASQAVLEFASVASAADMEGINGLPYSTSNDPRTKRSTPAVGTVNGSAVWFPAKYTYGGVSQVVVASGLEAQLIQAEAALQAGSSAWLDILNGLRTTCATAAGCPTPAPAGSGHVAGLAPLSDPGTADSRIAMLFQERAYWLYLTGQRQADLRRLVVQYHVPAASLYPIGLYPAGGVRGDFIDAPIPSGPGPTSESPNPLFHGCLSRD